MNLRLDETLLGIFNSLGTIWLLVAIACLGFATFGGILRAFGLAVLLLVAAQCWWTPAFLLGRGLRWWVLIIVCLRGAWTALGAPRPEWEGVGARRLVAALGAVALLSALWSDEPAYTFGVATSFVVTLVATFLVLWRLYDRDDIVAGACRGALYLALLLFGGSYAWIAISVLGGDWRYATVMGWEGRFNGVLFNANMVGILAMITIPAMYAAPRAWLGRGANLRWIAIALASLALFQCGSRSALVGTVVSLLILFLYRYGAGAVLTVALGSVGLYLLATTSNIEDIDATAVGHITRTKHIGTLSGRLDLWEEGLDAVSGREVLGLGWGNSRLLNGADPDQALERGNVAGASNLHSTHIQILVDIGFLGLGLLWLFCARVLAAGYRLLTAPRTERSVVSVMVLASFVATFADSFVHGSILSTGSPSALVFWSAAVVVLKESYRLRAGVAAPAPGPVVRATAHAARHALR